MPADPILSKLRALFARANDPMVHWAVRAVANNDLAIALRNHAPALFDRIERAEAALEGMLSQFAYYGKGGFLHDGGLSALEDGFEALGWTSPHPAPHRKCDEPGCGEEGTCGWPTGDGGYRRTCYDHMNRDALASRAEPGKKEEKP